MDQPAAQEARRGAPAPAPPTARAPAPAGLEHYDMTRDKVLLIFNNRDFQETKFRREGLKSLPSNDDDQERLTEVFSSFGFRVQPYVNSSADQIIDAIKEFSEDKHRNISCVCVAVMTHGASGGTLNAADRAYNLRELVEPLQFGHEGLVGKPKLFLVQACRGGWLDPGRVELDGPGGAALGSHADTLVLTACVEGYIAWGHEPGGSWLMQQLCDVLESRHGDLHLQDMATLVTSRVTRGYEAWAQVPDGGFVPARETPETRSTLTKLLRFSRV